MPLPGITLGVNGGPGLRCAAPELMFTIQPSPRSSIGGRTAWARSIGASTFTSNMIRRYRYAYSARSRWIPAAGVSCFDAVRGGEQKISTIGLNWYLNPDIRFMLDYQFVDVNRFNAAGLQVGQKYNALALRSQLTF